MSEPLTKPQHLRPEADRPSLAERAYGIAALVAGVIAFILDVIVHGDMATLPPWYLSLPGVVATAICASISVARRERGAYPFWLLGLGIALAGVVMGWFLMVGIVIAATAVVILILHAFM